MDMLKVELFEVFAETTIADCFRRRTVVDLQAIGEPRYALQMDVVDLYKTEIGASDPQEDFYDRHYLYGM